MTLEEFLQELRARASTRSWRLLPTIATFTRINYAIRTSPPPGEQCPITFVGGSEDIGLAYPIGQRLGLSWETITAILAATDEEDGHDPALRQALLEAVGLPQRQEAARE